MFLDYFRELTRPGSTVSKPEHQPESPTDFAGPLESIPASRRDVYRVYGNPGAKSIDKDWERRNMTTAKGLPGKWNKGRGKLYIHHLAEPYLREALRRADDAGCLFEIEHMGCFSFRHQRHDHNRPLSYHSFGIALDINPASNRARSFDWNARPNTFGPDWREWWPFGLSPQLVECFESVGWKWGGHWKRFVDPMHFELVR